MTKSAHLYFHRLAVEYHKTAKDFLKAGLPAKAHTFFALRKMMIERRKSGKNKGA